VKLYEKNYLISAALFLLLLYGAVFVIANRSFEGMLRVQRQAADRTQALLCRELEEELVSLGLRAEAEPEALSALCRDFVEKNYEAGASISVFREEALLAGPGGEAPGPGRSFRIQREAGEARLELGGRLSANSPYGLLYCRSIEAGLKEQRHLRAFLFLTAFVTGLGLMLLLYGAQRRIHRPMDELAHELRSRLTGIRGYGEYLLLAALEEEERQELTALVVEESGRLESLCEKLLILNGLRAGRLGREEILVESLFQGARGQFPALWCRPGEGKIRGDGDLLQSLVNNLVKNAFESGATKVEASFHKGCLYIRDNGRGMDEGTLALAKKPPKRELQRGQKGLGLALCHRICALHGARLDFFSKPGRGTLAKVDFTKP